MFCIMHLNREIRARLYKTECNRKLSISLNAHVFEQVVQILVLHSEWVYSYYRFDSILWKLKLIKCQQNMHTVIYVIKIIDKNK